MKHSIRPEPFKFLRFPSADNLGLTVSVGEDGESVTLSCKKPIKGTILEAEREDVRFTDQAIDLVPGDPQTVRGLNLNSGEVMLRHLGHGFACDQGVNV